MTFPSQPSDPRFRMRLTPSPTEIDLYGHVSNVAWVAWMQAVADAHWNATATAEQLTRYGWFVHRHEIDYRGNVGLAETVEATTWIMPPDRPASVVRQIDFHSVDRRLLVSSATTWVLIDIDRRRALRVPPALIAPLVFPLES